MSRATYHARVLGFSLDLKTDRDLVNLSDVIDSDGDLVTDSMCLSHGSWSNNLEAGENVFFTAKMKSRIKQHEIDGKLYNVRECYLIDPKIAK